MDNKQKYGRVLILGRPNTGKSTFLNAAMSQKVAITSHLPQTTRKNIKAVYCDDRGKILFIDTPGLLAKVTDLMGKKVNIEVSKNINHAQVIIMMVDISRPKNEEENKALGIVRKMKAKKILVYNKIDRAKGSKDHLAEYNYLEEEFDKTVAISAIKEKGVKSVIGAIFELLPTKTSKEVKEEIDSLVASNRPVISMDSNEFVSEIIREKAYLCLRDEIPYTVQVEVTKIKDKKKFIYISAFIYTSNDRYKKIIIGKNGQKIKELGQMARKELELMSQRKIYLDLKVKTDTHWMERV